MKGIAIFVLLSISVYSFAQDSIVKHRPTFNAFVNVGLASPLGGFSSSNNSNYPSSFARKDNKQISFALGVSFIPRKRFGINWQFVNYRFDIDTLRESLQSNINFKGYQVKAYAYSGYDIPILSIGPSCRFTYNGLALEPKLLIGIGSFKTPYFDIYMYKYV